MASHLVKILIAHRHALVRLGLRTLCGAHPDWAIFECADTAAAVARVRSSAIDLALLERDLAPGGALAAHRALRDASSSVRVLLLDASPPRRGRTSAASMSLLEPNARVLRRIEAAIAGHASSPRNTAITRRPQHGADGPRATSDSALTPREREVVRLVADGEGSKAIAAALGISTRTVESHRSNVMRKLDLRSVGALVRYAVREGLVPP